MSVYRCPGCDFVYVEVRDVPREGFPNGTPWDRLPEAWCCPDCAVRDKIDFEMMGVNQ